MTRRRRRGEEGSMLVEVTWLGMLLLVPIVYLLMTVFEAQNGAYAVSGAARAATRAYSLAPDSASGEARGRAAAAQVFADHDLAGNQQVVFICQPAKACHQPGTRVTAVVSFTVRLPFVPDFLSIEDTGINLESKHTVPIGQYAGATG